MSHTVGGATDSGLAPAALTRPIRGLRPRTPAGLFAGPPAGLRPHPSRGSGPGSRWGCALGSRRGLRPWIPVGLRLHPVGAAPSDPVRGCAPAPRWGCACTPAELRPGPRQALRPRTRRGCAPHPRRGRTSVPRHGLRPRTPAGPVPGPWRGCAPTRRPGPCIPGTPGAASPPDPDGGCVSWTGAGLSHQIIAGLRGAPCQGCLRAPAWYLARVVPPTSHRTAGLRLTPAPPGPVRPPPRGRYAVQPPGELRGEGWGGQVRGLGQAQV